MNELKLNLQELLRKSNSSCHCNKVRCNLCDGIHGFQRVVAASIFVVVPFHHGACHGPDSFEAFRRIGIVAHNIAKADRLAAALVGRVLQNGFQGLEVGVYVPKESNSHGHSRDSGGQGIETPRKRVQ